MEQDVVRDAGASGHCACRWWARRAGVGQRPHRGDQARGRIRDVSTPPAIAPRSATSGQSPSTGMQATAPARRLRGLVLPAGHVEHELPDRMGVGDGSRGGACRVDAFEDGLSGEPCHGSPACSRSSWSTMRSISVIGWSDHPMLKRGHHDGTKPHSGDSAIRSRRGALVRHRVEQHVDAERVAVDREACRSSSGRRLRAPTSRRSRCCGS